MTALGNIYAGSRITASDVAGVAPLAVIKGADQSLASSTAMQNDDALFLPVAANAGYLVECLLNYEGGTHGSSDLKWEFTGPSGATMVYTFVAYPVSGSIAAGNVNMGAATGLSGVGTAGTNGAQNLAVIMRGTLITGGTAGTLQLQWAQDTSSATATIVRAQSMLALWQVQ